MFNHIKSRLPHVFHGAVSIDFGTHAVVYTGAKHRLAMGAIKAMVVPSKLINHFTTPVYINTLFHGLLRVPAKDADRVGFFLMTYIDRGLDAQAATIFEQLFTSASFDDKLTAWMHSSINDERVMDACKMYLTEALHALDKSPVLNFLMDPKGFIDGLYAYPVAFGVA